MKRILMGVAYLIAASILAGSGVIGYSINRDNNDWTILALVFAGFFFFTAICYFAASKSNEIKEIDVFKKLDLLGDEEKENKTDSEKDNED